MNYLNQNNIFRLTKRDLFISVIFFILGLVFMYFNTKNEINSNKKITGRILDNCIQSMTVYNDLGQNCADAYNTIGSCMANLNSCDGPSTLVRLQKLNSEKEQLEGKLRNLTKESSFIIDELARKSNK